MQQKMPNNSRHGNTTAATQQIAMEQLQIRYCKTAIADQDLQAKRHLRPFSERLRGTLARAATPKH